MTSFSRGIRPILSIIFMTRLKHTLASFLLLLLMGCSSASNSTLVSPQPTMDDASVKLAEAASSVNSTLIELARIEAASTPTYRKNLTNPELPGMTDLVSVDWSGPIGQLVEKLAIASGYKVRVLGSPPAIPVFVSVTATNVPLGSVLRDLDFQAGKKAHIIAYPNPDPRRRVIELRYAAT